MGAQRTPEVTMFALLFFLLLGVVVLLAAAGSIWIDPTSIDPPVVDSTQANSSGNLVPLRHMPVGKDTVA